ncbi:FAD-binding oxidoreductase [Tateyamaria sp. SN6-1]|uniref:FAD-binding oxidoreductase n=1 Tax=Tateyamaria sp. SN6-1 TaxID=3092148 RepID=UPI0039F603AB
MTRTLTLRAVEPVTHDTNRYIFDAPANLDFEPGQAAELSIDKKGWREAGRPFTFTSLPGDDRVEFIIKIYEERDGVTDRMDDLKPGDEVMLDGPFGAITDQGPGTFIAAGAGITPFIPLLRDRARRADLGGCHLIFANDAARDIILRDEWAEMDLPVDFILSEEKADGCDHGQVDHSYLRDKIRNFDQTFYICGPQAFVDTVRDGLKALGADEDRIVTEEGW